jgi:hypothetical protein
MIPDISKEHLFGLLTVDDREGTVSFAASGSTRPMTAFLEGLSPHQYHCDNLKSCIVFFFPVHFSAE